MTINIGGGIFIGGGVYLDGGATPPAVPTSGMMLWIDPTKVSSGYGSTGLVVDISPAAVQQSGLDLTWRNGVGYTQGQAPTFNTSNGGYWTLQNSKGQYFFVGAYAGQNTFSSVTMSTWIKVGDTNVNKTMIAKEGVYKLGLAGATPAVYTTTTAGTYEVSSTFGSALTTGTWALISATIGSSGIIGYVNTTAYSVSSSPYAIDTRVNNTNGVQFTVAASQAKSSNPGEYWDGGMGPIMFWNRELSVAEITQIYNVGRSNYGL